MNKKLLSLLMAIVMTLSLTVSVGAAEDKPSAPVSPAADVKDSIVLLHTNDVHGGIHGYAKAKALKDAYTKQGAYVLLIDAGDFAQGDPTVNTTKGMAAIELMNLAEYDVCALGNHEFDYGYDNAQALAKAAKFPVLGANILHEGKQAFEGKVTFTAPDGTKIGVFGIDTPETATKCNPAKIKGLTFLGEDTKPTMFDCAQKLVDELKADGCSIIVCIGHLGTALESVGHGSMDLLKNVKGIDVLIDGHSHNTLEEVRESTGGTGKVGETYLTSTGTKLKNIGQVIIRDGKVASVDSLSTKDLDIAPDAAVKAKADEIQKNIDDAYGVKFAKTEVELIGGKKDVRTGETNMGDLIADAMLWACKKNNIEADIALTNGGGIRAAIAAGDITKKDINSVLPFGNSLSIVKITGKELLEALEVSTFSTPEPIGAFPQTAGIVFSVDTTKAYDAGDNYPGGSTYKQPKSIQRVTIESIGGKPFSLTETYAIATNDFLAAGGDTYYAFKAATSNTDLGIPLDQVVMDYITEELGGVVTAKAYGKSAGRLTVVTAPAAPAFTDVRADLYYAAPIAWAVENKITAGRTATTFAPDDVCSNANILTFMWRAAGSPEPTAANPYDNLKGDEYYYKAALWAAEKGIYSGKSFEASAPCTRAMTMEYFWKQAGSPETKANEKFTDVSVTAVYAPAVAWAVENKITSGKTESTFVPDATCTRGQIVTFLNRALVK